MARGRPQDRDYGSIAEPIGRTLGRHHVIEDAHDFPSRRGDRVGRGPVARRCGRRFGHRGSAGTESFLIAIANTHESVIAHGVFVGAGRDDDSNDNFDILHLGGGTVRINHPDSESHFTQHINPKTCYGTFTITGKYTLSGGTGRFKGATGHGKYKVSAEAVLTRKSTGACNSDAEPFEAGTVRASGPVRLP